MKKYYLHNGTEQEGPFDISDLKSKGITAKTEVWYEGISDWTNADEIDELKSLFSKATPPPIRPKSTQKEQIKKDNKLGRNLQLLGLVLLLGIIGFAVVPNLFNNNENPKSYIEQKMTIEETENSDPLRFLSVEGNYNKSFWGTEFKLKGKVTNRATIADYKDLVMRITYYSQTKSVIGTKDYTIYQVFQPNRVTEFQLDVENYKDVKSIGLDIVGAIPNN
tara:strand:+ start:5634 stop:6296 length:663 start_codon:yes stop_codon:yes gene_type:complete